MKHEFPSDEYCELIDLDGERFLQEYKRITEIMVNQKRCFRLEGATKAD